MIPNRATKLLYKAAGRALSVAASVAGRLRLSLVWHFDGPVQIGRRVHVRSVGGTVKIGRNVSIGPDCNIECATGATLIVGARTSINQGTFIVARSHIEIGDDVMIGECCSIRDNDHEWRDAGSLIREQGYESKSVVIGSGAWIGRGVSILKGVHVGAGAVVGANAVVTKDVEALSVVAGVPARPISTRR